MTGKGHMGDEKGHLGDIMEGQGRPRTTQLTNELLDAALDVPRSSPPYTLVSFSS